MVAQYQLLPAYLNDPKALRNASCALLGLLPRCCPHLLLLGSVGLNVSICFFPDVIPNKSICPTLPVRVVSVSLPHRCPLGCQEEEDICVSDLSGKQGVGLPFSRNSCSRDAFQVRAAWSWVVRGTGLSDTVCGQQARSGG